MTRPSRSLNWYEPGQSGIVPAGGRATIDRRLRPGCRNVRVSGCRAPAGGRVPGVSGRFSLSFPGRRGQDDPWFRIGAVDVNTSLLVALMCAVSLFVWAASPDVL